MYTACAGNVAVIRNLAGLMQHMLLSPYQDVVSILFCVPPTWDKEWNYLPSAVHLFKSPLICAEVRVASSAPQQTPPRRSLTEPQWL
jgi:hypothetical protein